MQSDGSSYGANTGIDYAQIPDFLRRIILDSYMIIEIRVAANTACRLICSFISLKSLQTLLYDGKLCKVLHIYLKGKETENT